MLDKLKQRKVFDFDTDEGWAIPKVPDFNYYVVVVMSIVWSGTELKK